jgi:hypothetical protein
MTVEERVEYVPHEELRWHYKVRPVTSIEPNVRHVVLFAGPSLLSPPSHIPYACLALALFANTHTLQGIEPSLRPHQSPLDSHGEETVFPPLAGPEAIDLGNYQRKAVSNVDSHPLGRAYFDMGLRLVSELGCGRRPVRQGRTRHV